MSLYSDNDYGEKLSTEEDDNHQHTLIEENSERVPLVNFVTVGDYISGRYSKLGAQGKNF